MVMSALEGAMRVASLRHHVTTSSGRTRAGCTEQGLAVHVWTEKMTLVSAMVHLGLSPHEH